MYFSIKPLSNSSYYNRESLEVIRNLQSLGYNPSGRISHDRQILQIAEYEKLSKTLAPTNEQKIQNSTVSFDDVLKNDSAQTSTNTKNHLEKNTILPAIEQTLTGTEQLAKMNKHWHNIAA